MDSLRYWVTEMHVDGFRFDLAPTLARQEGEFEKRSAFFDMVAQDPVVSRVKLIAEPWDVGQCDSYDLGRFPPGWREWNGKYRDSMRQLLAQPPVGMGEFASRFAGRRTCTAAPAPAHRLGEPDHRATTVSPCATWSPTTTSTTRPTAKPTATEPATTRSWNCGAEGPPTTRTCWPCGRASRGACWPPCCCRSASRCCSAATRRGRTQQGNNNAYCQDNEITWFDWSAATTTCWRSPGG
jgi:glycogen operon protein